MSLLLPTSISPYSRPLAATTVSRTNSAMPLAGVSDSALLTSYTSTAASVMLSACSSIGLLDRCFDGISSASTM